MLRRERSSNAARPDRSRRGRRFLIWASCSVVVLAIVAGLLFGRGILAALARQMAARQMDVGAVSAAQQWLARSAWLDPGDGRTDVMEAACFRHLEQADHWGKALELAERKGAPAARIEQEIKLGLIRSGQLSEGAENEFLALIEAGVSPHEVAAAFVHAYLAREEPEKAKMVLDGWAADFPETAHREYMEGVYWRWLGERARAQTEFENALARRPRHELARTALARLFDEQHRLDEALEQYIELATHSPPSETAKVGVARLLRKLGCLDEARAVLESLAFQPEPPSRVVVEMGQTELESGNYEEAERWFEQPDLDRAKDLEMLAAAASAFAFEGQITRAARLYARVDAELGRSSRIYDLRARLAIAPDDKEAIDEWQRLSSPSTGTSADGGASGPEPAGERWQETAATSVADLYALHCAACHGAAGDGNGHAARHLFPWPRDLRTGKSRLVSTLNSVPTPEDLEAVIRQGMPGTSMRSFENLSEHERTLLAQEVLRLNREGIREQLVSVSREEGEEIDDDELDEVVEFCTTPGEALRVPQIGPADSQGVVRGKAIYLELGCEKCHGEDGTGAWDTPLFDEKGRPSPPRDLAREPFKGGHEPESVYLRIFAGMPGTPHPACWNVAEEELVDVVHYCLSLSREPERVLTNYERALQATTRPYLPAPGGSASP